MTDLDRWLAVVLAAFLFGFAAGIRYAAPPEGPARISLDAALAYEPPQLPGDRLNPTHRDLVIATLQHALSSAAHAGAAARLRPVTPPCRVGIDCETYGGGP